MSHPAKNCTPEEFV